jgi:ubiquinone/menaquinone biosynthesis C-methylase UbiE
MLGIFIKTSLSDWLNSLEPRNSIPTEYYSLIPKWRSGNIPFVDLPYDYKRTEHLLQASLIESLAANITLSEKSTIIDLGTGDGWPSLPLAHIRPKSYVLALEASEQRLARSRTNLSTSGLTNVDFLAADIKTIPLQPNTIDGVVASFALEEAMNVGQAAREIFRVLKTGGFLKFIHQVWNLPTPRIETISLIQGIADNQQLVPLLVHTVRQQNPDREIRTVLVLDSSSTASEIHQKLLTESARLPSRYGEALLDELGSEAVFTENILNHLKKIKKDLFTYEVKRYNTENLVSLLSDIGFTNIKNTKIPVVTAKDYPELHKGSKKLFEIASKKLGKLNVIGEGIITAHKSYSAD